MYEWGEDKYLTNIKKHGVSFETAIQIFDKTVITYKVRKTEHNEIRHVSIGIIEDEAIIVVVYTIRNNKKRIISARPASRKERKVYYEIIRQTSNN